MTRNPMLAKVHIARKELGLDEDSYRDVMERITGQRSAAALSDRQLSALLDEFKRLGFNPRSTGAKRAGQRRMATSPHAGKIRALWITLYNLGLIETPTEAALAAFVRRQAKVEALQWLKPAQADKVIEALKAMATRGAGVDWSPYQVTVSWCAGRPVAGLVDRPRLRVIEAQWHRLGALGALRNRSSFAAAEFAASVIKSPCKIGLVNLTDPQADRVIETLGTMLRKALAKQAASAKATADRAAARKEG
jgi:phage gp16-like protein